MTEAQLIQEEVDNFLAFTGAEKPEPGSIFIVIMGMTGSGKSSFIAESTGRADVKVGHDLASCTYSLGIFKAEIDGRKVYLLDTPGFDDTNRSDMEILAAISHYFSISYSKGISINGVIYVHRISDTRVGGTSKRNIEMLKGLCGKEAYQNVAVVTNMWRSDDMEHQTSREAQLKSAYFTEMIEEGTTMIRHGPYGDSAARERGARDILRRLIKMWGNDQVTLQIQYEMVDDQTTLDETTAGRVLTGHLGEGRLHNENKIQEVDEQMAELNLGGEGGGTASEAERADLAQEKSKLRQQLEESRRAQEEMNASLFELHQREMERLMGRLESRETQWKAELEAKQNEGKLREEAFTEAQKQLVAEIVKMQQQASSAGAGPGKAGPTPQQIQQQQRELHRLEAKHKQELEKLRQEFLKMQEETEEKLKATNKAKSSWFDPEFWNKADKVVNVVGKGVGVVSKALITADTFCIVM